MNTAALAAPSAESHDLSYMPISKVLAHVALVQEIMKQVMVEGEHYGPGFPGDKKKNLLKPGAEKLGLAFGLVPEYEIHQTDYENGHREYRVSCVLRTRTGAYAGQGLGICSTLEPKYRYRNQKPKCPCCGKETIIKTGRGYWCPPDKGGCGDNPKPADIESQPRGKVENPDPAECYNTVLKIGSKRALVHAMIQATAAGDIFVQDAEEMAEKQEQAEAKEARQTEHQQARQQPASQQAPAAKGQTEARPTAAASSAAPASTPVENRNHTSSTNGATRTTSTATADPTAPTKEDCDRVFYQIIGEKGVLHPDYKPLVLGVWRAAGSVAERFRLLTELRDTVSEIIHRVTKPMAVDLISELTCGIDMDRKQPTPEQSKDWLKCIKRLLDTGEAPARDVTAKTTAEGGPDPLAMHRIMAPGE